MKTSRDHTYDLFGFFALVGAFIYLIVAFTCEPDGTNVAMKTPVCIETQGFTPQEFIFMLHLKGVQYPEVVLRQACQESGFFTSPVWQAQNNPFGFCYKGEYLTFNSYQDAIDYYKSWQDRYYKGGNYYEFLENIHYASDPQYVNKLRGIDLTNLMKYKQLNVKKWN